MTRAARRLGAWAAILAPLSILAVSLLHSRSQAVLPLVDFCDFRNIQGNPYVKDLRYAEHLCRDSYYRVFREPDYHPLSTLTYFGGHALWGGGPSGFRWARAGVLALNSLLVYALALGLLREKSSALAAALLHALHPIPFVAMGTSCAWSHLMMTSFLLSGLWLHRLSRPGWGTAGTCACYAAAVLCKQTAVFFPLLLLAHDLFLAAGPARAALRRLAPAYVALAATAGAYLAAFSLWIGPSFPPGPLPYLWPDPAWLPAERLGTALEMLMAPFSPISGRWAAAGLWTGLTALAFWGGAGKTALFFGAWTLASLLPFLDALPSAQLRAAFGPLEMAERYLFPASMAACLLASSALESLALRFKMQPLRFWAVAAGLSLLAPTARFAVSPAPPEAGEPVPGELLGHPINQLFSASYLGGTDPGLKERLRGRLAEDAGGRKGWPILERLFFSGDIYRDGRASRFFVDAINEHLPKANRRDLDPRAPYNDHSRMVRELARMAERFARSEAELGKAAAALQAGRLESALRHYDAALSHDRGCVEAELGKAAVYSSLGAAGSAARHYLLASSQDPAAAADFCAGRPRACRSWESRRVPQAPKPGSESFLRADAFHRRGIEAFLGKREDAALENFSRAIETDPGHVEAWISRAALRAQRGDARGALRDLDEAWSREPTESQEVMVLSTRASVFESLGDPGKAIAALEAAVLLTPADFQQHLACRRELKRLKGL